MTPSGSIPPTVGDRLVEGAEEFGGGGVPRKGDRL